MAKYQMTEAAAKRILAEVATETAGGKFSRVYEVAWKHLHAEGFHTGSSMVAWLSVVREIDPEFVARMGIQVVRQYIELRDTSAKFLTAFDELSEQSGHKHFHEHDQEGG